jgi:hypothetical protein
MIFPFANLHYAVSSLFPHAICRGAIRATPPGHLKIEKNAPFYLSVENFKPKNLAEPVQDGDRDCLASLLDDDHYFVDAAQS